MSQQQPETSQLTLGDRVARELRPDRLVPSLMAGLVVSVIVVIVSISLATLIFTGDLSAYLVQGIGMMLFSGIVITAIVALGSSYPGMVAYPQERVAPILALMAAAIVQSLSGRASPDAIYLTVVAGIIFATLMNGAFLSLLGFFRLGVLIRFIPYPVIGGFLAGTGYLLVKGSLGVMTSMHLHTADLPLIFEDGRIVKWLPGVAFGLLLVWVTHRFHHYVVMPSMLLGALAIFYAALWLAGMSPEAARADGWLLGPFPESEAWSPQTLVALAGADWPAILSQLPNLLTILFITVVSVLLNSGALELAVKRDIDLNRELKVAGVANLVIGLGGGSIGFHSLAMSRLVHRMGARSRLVGLIAAAACAAMLLFGTAVISYAPRVVLGGLLFFLGMHFLVEWVYEAWFRLTRADYLVVIAILGCVAVLGYLYGVAVGILACIILFLVNYSGINVVKHSLSGVHQQSNVDRPRHHMRILGELGARIHIFKLQGFIFFGTANSLLNQVRERVEGGGDPLRFILFDFRHVSGLDSSSTISLLKMRQLAEQGDFTLVFTQVAPDVQRQLDMAGFDGGPPETYRGFIDLDHALEWCEDRILEGEGIDVGEYDSLTLAGQLREDLPPDLDLERLLGYFEPLQVQAGHHLIRQGDPSDDLYLVEKGQVTASLQLETGEDVRLRTMRAGAIVGEIGMILQGARSANVTADKPSTVHRLSAAALRRMQEEDPQIAVAFHRFLERLLAERLSNADKAIRLLLG